MRLFKGKTILFSLLLIAFIIFTFSRTYSLLETVGRAEVELDVADWIIKINNTIVEENTTINVTNFNYESNGSVENGYFAPGCVGTYTALIDATQANVSTDFTFTIDTSVFIGHDNISLTLSSADMTLTNEGNGVYTGSIMLGDNPIKHLVFTLTWTEDGLHDAQDSLLINKDIPIDIGVNLKQHISS